MKPFKTAEKRRHEFAVLCWNVQKRTLTARFQHAFAELAERFPADIWLLQEMRMDHGRIPPGFGHLHHARSCNIHRRRLCYGVATFSTLPIETSLPYLSRVRELGVATRKSALLTLHRLGEGRVAVLNLHVVNFVPYRLFEEELERLCQLLHRHAKVPFVVAGDFNTWSPKRQKRLAEVMAREGMRRAEPEDARQVKRVLGGPLDHVYYRSLELLEARAVAVPVSDHNPIWAKFRL